jgi:hypothetical protein
MSYTQADAAIELIYAMSAVDINAMDPDEIETFARNTHTEALQVRDGFDESGN